jgi:group II intron reverse transcriptase/maturase
MLEKAYRSLNKDAASGSDRVSWQEYGNDLQANLINLEQRLKQKRYWPRCVRRVEIPKPNGKTRLLGIPAVEDKIVQQLAAEILKALFEPLFLDCSHAYRPKHSAKGAVAALQEEIRHKYVWVVEADIKGFFDNIDHDWLLKMVDQRVNDRAFTELIRRFLKAGVLLPDRSVEHPEQGTPQGGVVSPVLANIYLHFVLDVWFKQKVKGRCRGNAYLVRYADDFVAAFRYRTDAKNFYDALTPRLRKFGLETAEDKTRVLRFNRFDKERSKTFVFLGYEFRQTTSLGGNDIVSVKMSRRKISRTVHEFSQWCRDVRDKRIAWIMGMVKAKLRGISNYFSLPGNSKRRHEVDLLYRRVLYRWLNRRSERKSYNWRTFSFMWAQFMYKPKRNQIREGQQLSLWDCQL